MRRFEREYRKATEDPNDRISGEAGGFRSWTPICSDLYVRWLEREYARERRLLDDAMGLLCNHDQHRDKQWHAEYVAMCERYDADLGTRKGKGVRR